MRHESSAHVEETVLPQKLPALELLVLLTQVQVLRPWQEQVARQGLEPERAPVQERQGQEQKLPELQPERQERPALVRHIGN